MMPNPIDAFRAAMRAAGIAPPETIEADGQLHRFSTNGKRGDDAGWYCLHTDGIPAGAFGDWRSGESGTWRADPGRRLSPAEDAQARRRIAHARRKAEAARQTRARDAAARAAGLWQQASPAQADHPYLMRKGVAPVPSLREMDAATLARQLGYPPQAKGQALSGRILLVPLKVPGLPLPATLEMIDEEGRKSALAGGVKASGYWASGPLPASGRVVICEGVATALSIAQALGEPVAAALSVGNLEHAGKAIRAAHPGIALLIAADLGEGGQPHPQATQAARALHCPLVAPPAGMGKAADFNDLHQAHGLDAVRQVFEAVGDDIAIACAAGLRMEPVRWLWQGWLPRGMLTLLAGAPGCGKSTLAMALAATVSSGGRWPDGTCAEAADVVIWSGEDDTRRTLTPRLAAAGADLRRCHFVGTAHDADGARPFDPASDMPRLARTLTRIRPALLILDPIVSAVPGDSHKNAEVRRGLAPVVELAEALDCAVLGITHTSKGTASREPWERVTGSLAFAALARLVLCATTNRNAEENTLPPRLITRVKSNIGPDRGGFGYDITIAEASPGIQAARVQWLHALEGESRLLLAQAEKWQDADGEGSQLQRARRFLADLLADGPVAAKDIAADAHGAGFAWRTLHRAADALGVERKRDGFGKGAVCWWSLPIDAKNAHRCQTQKVGIYGGGLASMAETPDREAF
jgi:putative DNA primase/helicase